MRWSRRRETNAGAPRLSADVDGQVRHSHRNEEENRSDLRRVDEPDASAIEATWRRRPIDELVPEIVRLLELPQELADVPHGTTGRTELEYRSAWHCTCADGA